MRELEEVKELVDRIAYISQILLFCNVSSYYNSL
jgi:hypothetical protein